MLLPYVQPSFSRSSPWGSIAAPLRTGFDANHLIDRRLYGMAASKVPGASWWSLRQTRAFLAQSDHPVLSARPIRSLFLYARGDFALLLSDCPLVTTNRLMSLRHEDAVIQ